MPTIPTPLSRRTLDQLSDFLTGDPAPPAVLPFASMLDRRKRLQREIASLYIHENALNPFKYPSLVRMEREVVAMAADLFGGDPLAGTMASGGTESIFLAVHTARGQSDDRGVTAPNIVTAETVHPAFAKACHYLRIEHRRTPVGVEGRADPEAFAAAVDGDTILLVGSAPC